MFNSSPRVLTPKAFANSSPGLERSDNPGDSKLTSRRTLKGFRDRRTLSGLMNNFVFAIPGLERSDNPCGFKPKIASNPERVRRLANPFRVNE
jgi:hypothetical protein